MKVFARERLYTRVDHLTKKVEKRITDKYTFHFFEDKACSQCEWHELRKSQGLLGECEACAGYKGSAILAKRVKIKDHTYLATPLGDYKGLSTELSKIEDCQLVEKHPIIPIKPIKFTAKLRDYQEEAVKYCAKVKRAY